MQLTPDSNATPDSLEANLARLLNEHPVSAYQRMIIALCAAVALLDGFDTQVIGFVAPVIAKDWQVPLHSFGPIFAVGLVGGLIGAVAFGALADRIGRRTTLLVTVAVFGIGSLLTALAESPIALAVYRFVTGLGLGGAMPAIIALTSEYAPARLRTTLISAMFCGFPLGAVVSALVSSPLIDAFGWRAVFVFGGIAPLSLLPVIALALPESIAWLTARQRTSEIQRILARMKHASADVTTWKPSERKASKPRIATLFADGRAPGSLLIAAIFFVSLLLVFMLVSWIPSIAVQSGLSVRTGILAAAVLNLAGIVGSIVIGRISDGWGAYMTVGTAYLLGAAGAVAVGMAADPFSLLFVFCALAGFFCIGGQMCAVSIASTFYPTVVRATGVGWAMAMGRIGAIAGPLVGVMLVSGDGNTHLLFAIVAAIATTAGLLVIAMKQATRLAARP